MESKTIMEVISCLVGYTEPYGDTDVDETRYENQEKIIDLVMNGVEDLIENAKYRNRAEYSMKKIGSRAHEVLVELNEIIENALYDGMI